MLEITTDTMKPNGELKTTRRRNLRRRSKSDAAEPAPTASEEVEVAADVQEEAPEPVIAVEKTESSPTPAAAPTKRKKGRPRKKSVAGGNHAQALGYGVLAAKQLDVTLPEFHELCKEFIEAWEALL